MHMCTAWATSCAFVVWETVHMAPLFRPRGRGHMVPPGITTVGLSAKIVPPHASPLHTLLCPLPATYRGCRRLRSASTGRAAATPSKQQPGGPNPRRSAVVLVDLGLSGVRGDTCGHQRPLWISVRGTHPRPDPTTMRKSDCPSRQRRGHLLPSEHSHCPLLRGRGPRYHTTPHAYHLPRRSHQPTPEPGLPGGGAITAAGSADGAGAMLYYSLRANE